MIHLVVQEKKKTSIVQHIKYFSFFLLLLLYFGGLKLAIHPICHKFWYSLFFLGFAWKHNMLIFVLSFQDNIFNCFSFQALFVYTPYQIIVMSCKLEWRIREYNCDLFLFLPCVDFDWWIDLCLSCAKFHFLNINTTLYRELQSYNKYLVYCIKYKSQSTNHEYIEGTFDWWVECLLLKWAHFFSLSLNRAKKKRREKTK